MLTNFRRALRRLTLGPILRAARLLFGWLPWRVAQHLGALLGWLAVRVARRDRHLALEHLAIAFPGASPEERRRLVAKCYGHLGTSAAELLHLWGRPSGEALRHVDIRGFEHVEALRREGKAVLILTGHCGNWELISSANLSHGLGLAAIARELDEPAAQDIAAELRQHFGSETIARGSRSASRQLLRTLRQGGALALLIDQDLRADSVWVPFFGRLARTPTAGAEIALRLGAGVVPTFSERQADGHHLVTFHPPLELPGDVTEATAMMTATIEEQIRHRPEQWVWFHRRWRRRPPGELTTPRRREKTAGAEKKVADVIGNIGRA